MPSRPNAFRILVELEMSRIRLRPQVALEVDGLNAILSLVKEGFGHGVLPVYTLSNFDKPDAFRVRAIDMPKLRSELNLVWSTRRPSTATHRRALELVREVVAAALGTSERVPEAARPKRAPLSAGARG
jgi:LysR family transcriptional regulator, nitrogen assimilation regulatory protein